MLKSTRLFVLISIFLLLIGCAAQKKEMAETSPNQTLPIHINVSQHVNGGDSPLYVVIYQLKTTLPFASMNYQTLTESAYQALATSYVNSSDYYLIPGKQRTISLQLRPGAQYIGIFANYKKMDLVKWRQIIPLNALKKRRFGMQLTERGISLLNDPRL